MFKKVILFLFIVALIAVAGFIYLARNLDQVISVFKPQLESSFTSALKQPVALGEIQASLFPEAKIKVSEIIIGAGADQLAFKNVDLSFALAPLLDKQLVITELNIDSPEITLVKTKSGLSLAGLAKPQAESATQPNQEKPAQAVVLDLERVRINSADIIYEDRESNTSYRASTVDFEFKLFFDQKLLKLSDIEVQSTVPLKWELDAGELQFDLDAKNLKVPQITLALLDSRFDLALAADLDPVSMSLDISNDDLRLSTLKKQFGALLPALSLLDTAGIEKTRLKLNYESPSKYKLKGSSKLNQISLSQAGLVLSDLGGKLNFDIAPGKQKVWSNDLKFKLGKESETVTADVDLDLAGFKGDLVVNAKTLSLSNLESVLSSYIPSWKSYSASGTSSAEVKLKFKSAKNYTAQGKLNFKNISLKTNKVELSETEGPFNFSLASSGQSEFDSRLIGKLNGQKIDLKFNGVNNRRGLEIQKLDLSALQGKVVGTISTSAAGQFSSKLNFENLDLTDLLKALKLGSGYKLSGRLASLKTSFSGVLGDSLLESLQGSARLSMRDGTLHGINLGRAVLEKVDQIPFLGGALISFVPQEFDPYFESEDTPIKRLGAELKVKAGTVTFSDLKLLSDVYALVGRGSVDLSSKVNFNGSIVFDRDLSLALTSKVKELNALLSNEGAMLIPFEARGNYPRLIVLPDIRKIIQLTTQKLLQQKATDFLDKLLGSDQR